MTPLNLLVNGSKGRMGRTIIACAKADPAVSVAAAIDIGDDLAAAIARCDVVIEFSHHTATAQVAAACAGNRKALVIGTTGHTDEEIGKIRAVSRDVPVVFAPNFSVGVNALFWLAGKAVEVLGPDFDIEVVEMHHRLKKDAPSGTAKRLVEILAEARRLNYAEHARHGREGMVGERTNSEIGVHAVRGGDVVGDHTVIFAGQGERIELTHKASSRETFAKGAIRAAKWVARRPPGLYDMQSVLGL